MDRNSDIFNRIRAALAEKNKISTEIAADVGMPTSQISRMLTSMVANGKGIKRVDMRGKHVVFALDVRVAAAPRECVDIVRPYVRTWTPLTPENYNLFAARDIACASGAAGRNPVRLHGSDRLVRSRV